MSEHSKLVGKSLQFLNSRPNCFAFPVDPGLHGLKGTHDIIACFWGSFISLEVKVGHDTLKPHQRRFGRKVAKAMGKAREIRSFESLKEYIFSLESGLNMLETKHPH